MPAEIWVETIPYRETRNYVKNVLSYNMIYASRLGSAEKSMLLDLPRYTVQSKATFEGQANAATSAR